MEFRFNIMFCRKLACIFSCIGNQFQYELFYVIYKFIVNILHSSHSIYLRFSYHCSTYHYIFIGIWMIVLSREKWKMSALFVNNLHVLNACISVCFVVQQTFNLANVCSGNIKQYRYFIWSQYSNY